MEDAACAGKAPDKRNHPEQPDPWFPERGESHAKGKLTCLLCPVKEQCQEYSERTNSTYGMWGAEIKKRETSGDGT